jgi:quinol monooxygenase YgiN
MFTVLATLKLQPGKEEEAEAVLRELAARVEAEEPGTLAYIFHRVQNEPTRIVVFEAYRDEASFDAHRRGVLREFAGRLGSLLEPDSTRIEVLERFAGFQRS